MESREAHQLPRFGWEGMTYLANDPIEPGAPQYRTSVRISMKDYLEHRGEYVLVGVAHLGRCYSVLPCN